MNKREYMEQAFPHAPVHETSVPEISEPRGRPGHRLEVVLEVVVLLAILLVILLVLVLLLLLLIPSGDGGGMVATAVLRLRYEFLMLRAVLPSVPMLLVVRSAAVPASADAGSHIPLRCGPGLLVACTKRGSRARE